MKHRADEPLSHSASGERATLHRADQKMECPEIHNASLAVELELGTPFGIHMRGWAMSMRRPKSGPANAIPWVGVISGNPPSTEAKYLYSGAATSNITRVLWPCGLNAC